MKVFGLTGGVGTGKSTAAHLLQERGVSVIDTDALARRIVEPGQPALEEIKLAFGNEVIASDGRLRRDELAAIIFPNPQARQKLESITHPRIKKLWTAQIKTWRAEKCPLAVVVIPLLFETGETELDSVICVACTPVTQLQRLRERHWTPEQSKLRIAAQWPVEKKIAGADFVVWSEGGLDVLDEQLNRIFRPQ
jgi:dephospho-CoA kinase